MSRKEKNIAQDPQTSQAKHKSSCFLRFSSVAADPISWGGLTAPLAQRQRNKTGYRVPQLGPLRVHEKDTKRPRHLPIPSPSVRSRVPLPNGAQTLPGQGQLRDLPHFYDLELNPAKRWAKLLNFQFINSFFKISINQIVKMKPRLFG